MMQSSSSANTISDNVEESRAALQRCPPGHSHRSTCLYHLAINLHNRFQQRGSLSDLDEAIELHRAALSLRPPSHSLRSVSLNNLAISLLHRFEQQNDMSDLDGAIELHRAVLSLRPLGHSLRPVTLNNLGISILHRFERGSSLFDLNEAINLHRTALSRCPPGHSERSTSLNALSISLQHRFKQKSVMSDLDQAIELHRAALELGPRHSNPSMLLNSLAVSLQHRFQQLGVLSDLHEAIEFHRAALVLSPPGHPHRSTSLNNLANSLQVRFQQRGGLFDIDESIELHRAALELCPLGHPRRSSYLDDLAISLRDRFQQRYILSDLDEAIELDQVALALRPLGHYDRSGSLNNLANILRARFQQQGIPSDLDEAIELHQAALHLRPPGHYDRSGSLDNLATSLQNRLKHRGGMFDLDEAIELHRAALELRPLGHYDRSGSLNNLATSLQDRFKGRGDMFDLDEAIELHRAALELRPLGHYDRSGSLNNLATSLHDRFKWPDDLSDLDEAIELLRAALLLRPIGHSLRSMSLDSLARSLRDRFTQRGVQSDLDEVFDLYSQLSQASHSLAVSVVDLRVAKSWVISAEETNHGSALVAYQTALIFLDQHVNRLSSSSRNFDVVREATSSLAVDAFSCSVRLGAFTTAVELVEQGRAVFWKQLARFRTPLDELSLSGDNGAALAEDFKKLSFRLRDAFDQSNEDHSPQIRQLTMQWDDVVSRIRMMPDFSRFLLPLQFSDLQKATAEGPVIIVNASQYSCDALIILSGQDPIHVPLDITWSKISELSSEFQSRTSPSSNSGQLLGLVTILRQLWNHIVDPVVQALRESKVPPRSRIWWCPTAEFMLLPLHAAGPYERNKYNLSHFYISSYTSTLTALLRARQQVSRDSSSQQFVAIGQGNPDSGSTLQHVALELAVVAQHVAPVVSFKSLSDSHATVQGVFDALSQTQWLHLACHGKPNRQQPFESYFAMRDGPIRIKDIIRSHWQHPEFAFLSSSHTTVGDEMSPDESINLAAAMQFSGFRSVIGSMGDVDDEAAHQVASAFYGKLIDSSGRLDCTQAAVALHKALKSLRNKIPLEQQITFVHIGV